MKKIRVLRLSLSKFIINLIPNYKSIFSDYLYIIIIIITIYLWLI